MYQEEYLIGVISIAGEPILTVEEYEGPYTFTPTTSNQTVQIANKKATQNITIEKIPNNYGLITWNGITLTVS